MSTETVAERIRTVTALAPERSALFFNDQQWSWGALAAGNVRLASALESAGIGKDALIGLLGRNWPAVVTAFLGIIASERGLLLINPIRPADLVAAEIADLNLEALVIAKPDWTDALRAAAKSTGTLVLAVDFKGADLIVETLLEGHRAARRLRTPETVIEIQTSGTTGTPKRIPISERAISGSLRGGVIKSKGVVNTDDITPKSSPTLVFGPLVHTSGTFNVLMAVFEARPIVLFEKFDPRTFAAAVRRFRPKFAPLPPTALKMLLDSEVTRDDLSSLLAVRSGTAALPLATHLAFEKKFGIPVLTNYGATEFMGTITGWSLDEYRRLAESKRGSVGKASPGVILRVVDPASGDPLAVDETGILEAKVSRIDGGKDWIRTSDLARLDADDYLYLVGRADDAIIRGGFKIMAGKVGDVIRSHPGVFDVLVLALPDERLGQLPVAAVESVQGMDVTAEELKKFAKERLNPYEVPAQFLIVDRLPRTVSDKISRPETLKLFTAEP